MPRFQAYQPAPPSSSPPVHESSFVMCHVSRLTNLLLPLPPLQLVSLLRCATFPSSPICSSLFLPSSQSVFCNMPCFQAHQPAPPSFSLPAIETSFVICHISKLTNPLPDGTHSTMCCLQAQIQSTAHPQVIQEFLD